MDQIYLYYIYVDPIKNPSFTPLLRQHCNGNVISTISGAENVILAATKPDPIQLKIERIMNESTYERKMKTCSKNMSIFKWLLRFFACFFLTLR